MYKNTILDELIELDSGYESNLQLPSPQLLQYYRDEHNRIISIVGDIDSSLLDQEDLIRYWNQEDDKLGLSIEEREPIKIYIYSYGGDGNVCLSFIDTIKMSKTPIKTICRGVAMSAAAMIFIAAPRGNRYMYKNASVLFHQGSSSSSGTAQMMLDQAEDYKHFLETMKNIVLDNTNINKALYTKMSKKEWYIYSENAIELGVCDHIVESFEELI